MPLSEETYKSETYQALLSEEIITLEEPKKKYIKCCMTKQH